MPSIALNSSLKIFSHLLENKFKTKNVEQQYRLLDQLDWSEIANAATEMIFPKAYPGFSFEGENFRLFFLPLSLIRKKSSKMNM